MPIRILPKLLVSQIAAGEVIERPASVVKELIDNSLDAGATQIDIAVEEGGQKLIRIADDGSGIAPHDLSLAITAHATSKLQTAEQLSAITTLGFRGEALASIASVSRLRMTSRPTIDGKLAEEGACIQVEGDQVTGPEPAACSPGTVIEIRDLFYSTPARRRFMRAASTEYARIADVVNRTAMVHPHVGFTLTHNQRKTVNLPSGQDRRSRCVSLLGKELDEVLLEIDTVAQPNPGTTATKQHPASVWGLAGTPTTARATSKFQYLFINGRPIRDRNIAHAVKEAYRGLIPNDRHPLAVVCIELDPNEVDVNVHPTKAEVRFREPNRIHGLVLTAIRQCLLGADLTPTANLPSADTTTREDRNQSATTTGRSFQESSGFSPQKSAESHQSQEGFVDYFRSQDPKQRGFDLQDVREQLHDNQASSTSPSYDHQPPTATLNPDADPVDNTQQPTAPPPSASPVLQVHGCYLVTQDEDGLVIVDQHALHERVMFEELRRRVLGKSIESQRLLTPVILQAAPARIAAFEEVHPLLERIGIEIDQVGPQSLAINGFPSLLFERHVEPIEFVEEILDKAVEGELPLHNKEKSPAPSAPAEPGGPEEIALNKVLAMMACKAAVKAGDSLAPQEIQSLLAQREHVDRSSACPHGRPTTVRLTLRDMERHFKRT